MISGTCNENGVVDKDGITLDGQGSGYDGMNADAAALLIKDRRNVTIRGLTVQEWSQQHQDSRNRRRVAGGCHRPE